MKIQDFKVGNTAYVLNMHRGYSRGAGISEHNVIKVGRRYVTLDNFTRYCYDPRHDDALMLDQDWGGEELLYKTREAALTEIERNQLVMWLRRIADKADRFSIGKLRQVREILEA